MPEDRGWHHLFSTHSVCSCLGVNVAVRAVGLNVCLLMFSLTHAGLKKPAQLSPRSCHEWSRCEEVVVATTEHRARVIVRQGAYGDGEVAKHGVRFPASENAVDVAVDAPKEHRHCTACAEGFGGDFLWCEARGASKSADAITDGSFEVVARQDLLRRHIEVAIDGNLAGAQQH